MLSAFHPLPILELKARDKSRIESVLAYGDRLLVGLNTGFLRVYRVNNSSDESPPSVSGDDAPPPSPTKQKAVELLREEDKFSRKPVTSLAIVKEANLLVSLSDAFVSLHDLQTYALVERLERSKGALCFTVTSNVVKDAETGVPSLVSRLAVGVKRRLLVWTWRDMELEEGVVDEAMEGAVKSLTWATGSGVKVVVGMDAGFSVVDVETLEVVPVNKSSAASRLSTSDANGGGAAGELAGIRFAAVSSSGMGYMGMTSWIPRPMATGLTSASMMLAKDVNTLFISPLTSKTLEKRQIPWSHAPEAIGYSYPYLLALQSPERGGSLQIRNPDTLSLLQTISLTGASLLHVPQPNISLAHAGKGFLVASDRTIWRMSALPYPAQLSELVEKQRFDEAISLLGLLEDTLIDDKAGRIREVMILKASHLFQQQKYRPALDLFTDAQADPHRVISLFPRSIAGDVSSVSEPEPDVPGTEAEPPAAPAEQHRRETPLKPLPEDPINSSLPAVAPVTPSKGMLSKLRGAQSQATSTPTPPKLTRMETDNMSIRQKPTPAKSLPTSTPSNEKPLEGEDLKLATRCLCSFLAYARVQIQKHLTTDGELRVKEVEMDAETGKPVFANLLSSSAESGGEETDWQAELLRTAKLVDTTLFRAYMLALPSLAGPLFRLDNFCDPEVVQESLYKSNRYNDMIDFLHGKKLHRQALEMLQKFGKEEAEAEVPEGMRGPQRTVSYLQQLPPELVDIVLEFARWPVDVEPEVGMEIFTADTENAERLPRDQVLEFLGGIDKGLEAKYLEHIITEWGDQNPDFHQRLAEYYVDVLMYPSERGEEKEIEGLKGKLETFLRKSRVYNKARVFRTLPTDKPVFYETRAIVLSAMGNHKQALSIYVFQLHSYEKAEAYCTATYLAQQIQPAAGDDCLIDPSTPHQPLLKPTIATQFEPEDSPTRPNTFAILLGLYLRPPANEEKRWPQAHDLLSRHGARLPASSTLDLMPSDLHIAELNSYFAGRMRHATSLLRMEAVTASLSSVQRAAAERALAFGSDADEAAGRKGGKSRRARVTEESMCGVCNKRFGASAVRVWPGGAVSHYGCVLGSGKKSPATESRVGSRRW